MMMNKIETDRYKDISKHLESLYLSDEYEKIIEVKSKYEISFLFDSNKNEYPQLIEIFTATYIELEIFDDALTLINSHINLLIRSGYDDDDSMDDLTTFFQFKIIVYQKTGAILKEYRTIKEYIAIGGQNNQILDFINDVEFLIFNKIVFINKILLVAAFTAIVLVFFLPPFSKSSYVSIITGLIIGWVLLNYIFHKNIKKLFFKLLDRLLVR